MEREETLWQLLNYSRGASSTQSGHIQCREKTTEGRQRLIVVAENFYYLRFYFSCLITGPNFEYVITKRSM